ncbi:hypothetical protein [Alkaliflexus imshenetskii]|uniref:hypothetical protein n=1 Tax=Alkaliflexus imshenetskii TaxID=286730 RepID=UPI00047C5BA4|nr:hypothetical protein [Alkaliflexus imshenetskii]
MAKKRIKQADRAALSNWEEFRKEIMESTMVDNNESEADKRARIAKLEADDEAWFKYYFPKYYKNEPAPFHKRATKRIMVNNRWYEVRAWSRELAKSARAMMEFTKLAMTGKLRNILLISNSQDNAERLLMPFMLNLESNGRLINDYGTQEKPGNWETGEFTTLQGVAFRALGAGQSPRGTRNEEIRPDGILVDDIDTDEECRNPDRIKKKWAWIEKALIPTVSVSGNYRILFNGNIIAKDCCITRAMEKADHVDVVNIRDKDGKSSWPQKNSETDIDKILSLISSIAAQQEYFNNPVSEGDVFTEMVWGTVPPLNRFKFLVAYGDPAPSNSKNKKGSFKANFLIGFYQDKYYVVTGFLDHPTNAEFVEWYYDIKSAVGDKTQVYNYIENNTLQDPFYEQVFIPLFATAAKERGFIGIVPDTRKKPDKFSRIEGNLEPLNRMGKLILNEKEKSNPHMQRLEDQFLMLDAKLSAPADGPDCVEGGVWVINQKMAELSPGNFSIGQKAANNKRF